MPRVPRPSATTRSEHWLRVLVNQRPDLLTGRLRAACGWRDTEPVEWLSPLAADEHAEYRDEAFLERLGVNPARVPLPSFWPTGGPRWDGLGRAGARPLLVEAKAHIEELASNPCGAGGKSLEKIRQSLNQLKGYLGSSSPHDWSSLFYQYTNRLAHLYFLRELNGVDAVLVLVYFVNAPDVPEPATEAEWRAANRLLKKVLGLGRQHRLARHIAEVYIDVAALTGTAPPAL